MVGEIPRGIRRSITDVLSGKKIRIVEMVHEEAVDLSEKRIIYRLALAGKKEKDKKRERISAFIVKAYESAIMLQLGKFIGVIPEGLWEIEKEFQYTGTEIIWVDKTEFKTRWGLADIYLKDNVKIGAHGSLVVKISDPKNFVLNVVSDKQMVERAQVDKFIFEHVAQTYKDVLGEFSINDVTKNRDLIKQKVNAKLYDLLSHWGIELTNLEIEGLKLPEEFEEIGQIAIKSSLEKRKVVSERDLMKEEIETIRIKSDLEAEKRALEAEKKSFERDQEILDAKAGYEKAKHVTAAKEMEGRVSVELLEKEEKAKVAGDVAKIEVSGEKVAKIVEAKARIDKKEEEIKKEQENRIKKEITELKEKLNQLDDLLAEGKVSQDIYKMRVTRIEKDIKDLENKLID
jgi:regulator of protease activity HflC (stomatin/prohibitin superfamily)